MDWEHMRRSDNVEEQRSSMAFGRTAGKGIGGFLVALVAGWALGINPLSLVSILQGWDHTPLSRVSQPPASNDHDSDFVRAILGDIEDIREQIFQHSGEPYDTPRLILFTETGQSACGLTSAAVGPFYCPQDAEVSLDLGFLRDVSQHFGAPGDFARAYVIAHEVGYHLQYLLEISAKVQAQRRHPNAATRNVLSVWQELQADCFAEIWGHYTAQRGLIDQSDVTAALHAAAQSGDERLQKCTQGYVVPGAFTHGSVQPHVHWFQKGVVSEDPTECNTFMTNSL